jgi:serine/tyrosine/threonine adenylyltransferase
MNSVPRGNPLLALNYEPALESLEEEYYDRVTAAEFPQHILRFRNDDILAQLSLDPQQVSDADFIEAFGRFHYHPRPLLALRYHGYQFGEYNRHLGDGRGFLYGQVRGNDGELYDFGTKGSGTTPYSRNGDGRLTLKGGVREVLAAEMLHRMKVRTSRCFSLIETGESLWRGDEPSPTRSSVMVRFNRSHIRFGTFERLHYLERQDLIQKLLDHVIQYYYPDLVAEENRYCLFYTQLVKKVAKLAAQWMVAGFCHAVLNTDNMSITGESFDYGPFAFIPTYDLKFTAAYFDYYGRYSYGNQPGICRLNLQMLQAPLALVMHQTDLDAGLAGFEQYYYAEYKQLMLDKLGLGGSDRPEHDDLLDLTIKLLHSTQTPYQEFFINLPNLVVTQWDDFHNVQFELDSLIEEVSDRELFSNWQNLYQNIFNLLSEDSIKKSLYRMQNINPKVSLIRPQIETVWEAIDKEDNWQPFTDLLFRIKSK